MDSDTISKPAFFCLLPTDLFKVIQTLLSLKDYRSLMNCNKATFANIKYETVVYRIEPAKYLELNDKEYEGLKMDEAFYYNLINHKVKDKSKQVSVSIITASLTQILPFVVGLQGIKELCMSNENSLNDMVDFNLFNNIHTVQLWRFRGVQSISSGFENVKELNISCFYELESITNINTTKTLEVVGIYLCDKLNLLNFPLNNIVCLHFGKANQNFNLQTITSTKLKELSIEFDEPIENVLLNPVDFASLQVLSLSCHFLDSFHNFSLFENIDDLRLYSKSDTSISISLTKFNGKGLSLKNFKIFGLIQNMSQDMTSFITIQQLRLIQCHDFTEVPSLPELKELSLTNCDHLKSIPSFKNLKKLVISECPALLFISPDQPRHKQCFINSTKIEDVSFASHCQEVYLRLSSNIKDISILRQVKSLEISECHGLTSLDELSGDPLALQPDQRYLSLSELYNVHAFSLHHILSLRLFGLPHLRSCEGIHHIEHLHIHKCNNVKSTLGLKHVTRVLDISDCPLFDSLVDVEGIPLIRLKGNSRLKDYSAVQDEWTDCGVMDKGVELFALKAMKEEMKEPGWKTTIARLLRL